MDSLQDILGDSEGRIAALPYTRPLVSDYQNTGLFCENLSDGIVGKIPHCCDLRDGVVLLREPWHISRRVTLGRFWARPIDGRPVPGQAKVLTYYNVKDLKIVQKNFRGRSRVIADESRSAPAERVLLARPAVHQD